MDALEYVWHNPDLHAAIGAHSSAALGLEYLGAGEHNFNYVLQDGESGRKHVLRVNVVPQVFHKDQISYEYAALKAVEASGCTPRVLFKDTSPAAPRGGVLVMEYCEGDELDFDHLREGDIRCAAQLMANIHAVDVGPACPLHRPEDPLEDLWAESQQRFGVYLRSGAQDARITKWVERFCNASRAAMDASGAPSGRLSIVHTETLPSHFLIPAQAAQAAAGNKAAQGPFCAKPGFIIDWERPVLAEPAQDVAYFTGPTMTYWDSSYLFPACDVEAFVESYWHAVDGRFERGNFDARFSAYRMLTTLRSVGWCCKALVKYGSVGAISGSDKTARKLPVYLSDSFMELLANEVFGL